MHTGLPMHGHCMPSLTKRLWLYSSSWSFQWIVRLPISQARGSCSFHCNAAMLWEALNVGLYRRLCYPDLGLSEQDVPNEAFQMSHNSLCKKHVTHGLNSAACETDLKSCSRQMMCKKNEEAELFAAYMQMAMWDPPTSQSCQTFFQVWRLLLL